MVNQKIIIWTMTIEAVVGCWYQSIVDDLENVWKSADEHVGGLFEVR